MPYLVSSKWLLTNQSGNMKWHSTKTSLIHTCTADGIVKRINQKKTTAVVLLDLSKAFNSINHSILLDKLQDVGASTSLLRMFTSYLSERNKTVCIGSTLSDALLLASGILQGSILGPLLFTIYVNDLLTVPKICSSDCYVDDTKLYMSFGVQNCKNAVSAINEDLFRFRDWCDNRLLINPEKTKLILYRSRQMRKTSTIPTCCF